MLHPDTEAASWGGRELCYAHLGDARLKTRAAALLTALAAHPDQSLPAALADPAALCGAYRFLANPAVKPAALRQAHRTHTLARLRPLARILIVQDTTELDYQAHPATTGLGPLTAPSHHGLHVHSALALTAEGVPLGVLHQHVWVRDPATQGQARQRRTRAQADKESQRWLDTLAASLAELPSHVATLTIADREADIYALLAAPRPATAHLLIRATHNRVVSTDDPTCRHVWDAGRAAPPADARVTITLPRGHTGVVRDATLTLRWTTVTLHAPHGGAGRLPDIQLVLATEEAPPAGSTPIEWLLLTTQPVATFAEALACVQTYARRWLIERYHYVLKSGCTIETVQLASADALQRLLALYSIVAWRILHLTYLGRAQPDAPATRVLTPAELTIAAAAVTGAVPADPRTVSVQTAIRWVARLGGFLGRPRDGEPGPQVLWRGVRRLADLVEGARLAQQLVPPLAEPPLVRDA